MRTSHFSVFRIGLAFAALFFITLLSAVSAVQPVEAQSVHGISGNGTDYYVSRMPILPMREQWEEYWNGPIAGYFLISSFAANNHVHIDYFQSDGTELTSSGIVLGKGRSVEYQIDQNNMTPARPGETPEWKCAHIYSDYPITVQYYYEGTSSGSLFNGIPTAALGENYVVAAYNDVPTADAPNQQNADSTSSEFLVIAPYNNTQVTITPNSTTYAGLVGVNTGDGATGQVHPFTVTLQRGQVYWVRSRPTSLENDLSGSTVVATKPVAVLGGQERAMINDPQGTGGYNDEDERDACVEEMTPVESWGTDYPSIPTMPASNQTSVNNSGDGDLYRIYANDPNGMAVDMWQYTSPAQLYGPQGVNLYQAPPANWSNVTEAIDLRTEPHSTDASGALKPFYPVQYQYFQWQESNEMNYRSCNEMDLIPIDHWELSTAFDVPTNSHYNGYQFINIITNKDSTRKIFITENGTTTGTLANFIPPVAQYQIPLHPELIGMTFKLPSGSYLITGNTPFACYSYGRTELTDKAVSGYAAPTGQIYGGFNAPGPKVEVMPSCGQWNIHITEDTAGSLGLADFALLNDPDGFVARPAEVSTNVQMSPKNPSDVQPNPPGFEAGQKSLDLTVTVGNPADTAFAAVYVVDRAGNDTIIMLHYTPPSVNFSETRDAMPDIIVGDTETLSFTFHVDGTGATDSIYVDPAAWRGIDKSGDLTFTTKPTLPAWMHKGDSIVFHIQFTSIDTNLHMDSLILANACFNDSIRVQAKSLTPIIYAGDLDFGNVPVGDTSCHDITIQNTGDAPLLIDSNWWMIGNPNFSFEGYGSTLPLTIPAGKTITVHFCFHPSVAGSSSGTMRWGSNLSGLFSRDNKDTSVIIGRGTQPGLSWSWPDQLFTVKCDQSDTVRLWLDNTIPASSGGGKLTVNDIDLVGQSMNEFTLLGYGTSQAGAGRNPFPVTPFELYAGDSEFVDVIFNANLANGYADRIDSLFANATDDGGSKYTDTMTLTGRVRHAIVAITPTSYNYGLQLPGAKVSETFTLTNTGDTDFNFGTLQLPGTDFEILSQSDQSGLLAPGATDTIVIQYTAKQSGGFAFDTASGYDDICTSFSLPLAGEGLLNSVTEIGHQYPLVYLCHDDSAAISTTNVGTFPMLLNSVAIMNAVPNSGDSAQFSFIQNGNFSIQNGGQLISMIPSMPIDTLQTLTFPVLYTPTNSASVSAVAVFYYEDTSKGQQRYFIHEQSITGVGYATTNTVALQSPTVSSQGAYTAVTSKEVTMPVNLLSPFDSIAQVYGVRLTIRYYGDVFQFLPTTLAAGITNLGSTNPVVDPTDSKYDLLTLDLRSLKPIETMGTLATLNWQYVVAKDSISPFQILGLAFLDQRGDSECWVSHDSIPAQFYGQNLCGDATLRNFLKGGLPVLSIGDVFPNPATQSAAVNFTVDQDATPVTLRVYNALGEPVQTVLKDATYEKGSHMTWFDASCLPSGLYTIYLTAPGVGVSKQVLVTK